MWRKEGEAELYLYLPAGLNQNDHKCGKAANEACETSYGASVGRGTWTWQTGVWQTVSQRILLNTPGKPDGEAEVYVDGRSVLNVGGLTWRGDPAAVVQGAQMQIFFGGVSPPSRTCLDAYATCSSCQFSFLSTRMHGDHQKIKTCTLQTSVELSSARSGLVRQLRGRLSWVYQRFSRDCMSRSASPCV